jgi:hypothetical protein
MTTRIFTMGDLKVGDDAVFDADYGSEQVTEITEMWVGGTVGRDANGETILPPFVPATSMPGTMFKFGVRGRHGPRYILRFLHEPVSRAAHTIPRSSDLGDGA